MSPKVVKKVATKKVEKKSEKKVDNKPLSSDKPMSRPVPADGIRAVIVMLFTKCKNDTYLLIGQEIYEKWGLPTGHVIDGESRDKTMENIFQNETGYQLPKIAKHVKFLSKRDPEHQAEVHMILSNECIEAKLGPKVKSPAELLALRHIPVNDLYKFINSPSSDVKLRAVFVSTMIENKSAIESFLK
jgi:ADP-ribose pyrophosphatase YjhB (NUDIX family)